MKWVAQLVAALLLQTGIAHSAPLSLAEYEWQQVFDTIFDQAYRASAYSGGTSYSTPEYADVDNDGDLDLFLGNLDGSIIYYENGGAGTIPLYKSPDFKYSNIQTAGLSYPDWVDVDGDGDLDLIVGDSDGSFLLYVNNGTERTPHLAAPIDLTSGLSTVRNARPRLVDIDSDGLLDLYFFDVDSQGGGFDFYALEHYEDDAAPGLNFVHIESGVAGISPIHPQAYPVFADAPNVPAPGLCFGDINDDGLQDLMVGKINGFTDLFLNTGTLNAPSFTLEQANYNFQTALGDATPELADFDADGDLDLFTGAFDGAITLFPNKGSATNAVHDDRSESFYGNTDFGGPTCPLIYDWNNDGDEDLLLGHHFGFLINLENRGTPANTQWQVTRAIHIDALSTWYIDQGAFASQVTKRDAKPAACDYDGDGDIDLVVNDISGDYIYLHNTGNDVMPLWELGPNPFPALSYNEVVRTACGDLNGDTLFDLVVGREDGSLDFIPNTGNLASGVWDQVTENYTGVQVNSHASPLLADMDLDGDLDLVLGAGDGTLTLIENIGTAQAPQWTTPIFDYTGIDVGALSQPAAMDFDGDGDMDLFVGQAVGGLIALQNQQPHLVVRPFNTTAIEGSDIQLTASPTATEWGLMKNRSGASIDPTTGTYTAGTPAPGSSVFRFTADLTLNDAGEGVSERGLRLTGGETIESLEVAVEINHPDRTELHIALRSPTSGVRVVLYDGSQAAPGANLSLLFSDDGPNPPVSGQLSDFAGERAFDNWFFEITDTVPGNRGQLLNLAAQVNNGQHAVDIIEARNADGLNGCAFVNVVNRADAGQAGKAIIIAGGRDLADPVWTATNFMAQKAYNTLLQKGYAKTNIYYLSLNTDIDVDSNGLLDDIDGPADLAHATIAFETFATDALSLVVYLTDHGSETVNDSFFRLNGRPEETISASQLSTWLGTLSTSGINITTIMDFCYAGSFVPPLAAASTADHQIIAACAADELTYFIAGGVVSFSSIFFNALLQNLDVLTAFNMARGGMVSYQHAQLDDDADGLYDPDADGDIAQSIRIGGLTSVGRDIPHIGTFTPNQELEGDDSVLVYVREVYTPHQITGARAVVFPPNHKPDLTTGNPVVDLVELKLILNPLTHQFEARHSGFKLPGVYTIIHFVEDTFGGVSYPKQSFITQSGVTEKSIILIGEMPDATEQSHADAIGSLTYNTLRSRLLPDENIGILHPAGTLDADADGTNDVQAISTAASFFSALNAADDADILNIFLIGTMTNGQFALVNADLGPVILDAMLDSYQSSNRQVRLFIESNDSGSWIPLLTAPSDRKRLVVASTAPQRRNVLEPGLSFTDFLMNEIQAGSSLHDAVQHARRAIRRTSNNIRQHAQIDDNGNGKPNEKNVDGQAVRGEYIGTAFVTGEDIPFIGVVTPFTTVTNNTVLLFADLVTDADGIARVFCDISSPSNFLGQVATRVELIKNPTSLRWELNYDGLEMEGIYQLAFQAEDTIGHLSAKVQSTVLRIADHGGPIGSADAFEPDDGSGIARNADLPARQNHSLHHAGDCDWVSFYASSNHLYDIETIHISTNLDTVIEIYFQGPDGQLLLVDRADEFGYELGELAGLSFPTSGIYFVKVCAADDTPFTPGDYQLIIHVPAGLSGIYVIVHDVTTNKGIPFASVSIPGLGSRITDSEGQASFINAAPGNYSISVTAPDTGYQTLFGLTHPSESAANAQSDYGNPRTLGRHEFQELSFGGGQFYYMAFGFFQTARVDGRIKSTLLDADVSGATVVLRRTSDLTVFNRFPYAFADLWQTGPDGQFPDDIHLPPNDSYLLYVVADTLGYEVYVHPLTLTLGGRGSLTQVGDVQLTPSYSGNALPDPWEIRFGLDPAGDPTIDFDLDGQDAASEYIAGTSPLDGNDRFVSTDVATNAVGELCLKFTGMAHRVYTLEQNLDLRQDSWTPSGPTVSASQDNQALEFKLPIMNDPVHFRITVSLTSE